MKNRSKKKLFGKIKGFNNLSNEQKLEHYRGVISITHHTRLLDGYINIVKEIYNNDPGPKLGKLYHEIIEIANERRKELKEKEIKEDIEWEGKLGSVYKHYKKMSDERYDNFFKKPSEKLSNKKKSKKIILNLKKKSAFGTRNGTRNGVIDFTTDAKLTDEEKLGYYMSKVSQKNTGYLNTQEEKDMIDTCVDFAKQVYQNKKNQGPKLGTIYHGIINKANERQRKLKAKSSFGKKRKEKRESKYSKKFNESSDEDKLKHLRHMIDITASTVRLDNYVKLVKEIYNNNPGPKLGSLYHEIINLANEKRLKLTNYLS